MTKSRSLIRVAVCLLLGLSLAACGKVPPTYYYTVRYQGPHSPASAVLEARLGVAIPEAEHLLRQDRIVYFTGGSELNYYQYHRWAESPTFMVQSLLLRQLRGARLFTAIVPYRAQKGLDYVLRGRLLALEEVDSGPSNIIARFGLELELVRQEDGQVVWTGRAQRERSVASKTVGALVEALNGCVAEVLDQLSGSLREAVMQLQPTPAAAEEGRE